MIVLATLGRAAESVIDQAGPAHFSGKTVIDATNPLADAPPVNGVLQYFTGPNESLGERIKAKLSAAHVVRAFNSMGNTRMVNRNTRKVCPRCFFAGIARRRRGKSRRSPGSSVGNLSTAEPSPPHGRSNPSASCGAFPAS